MPEQLFNFTSTMHKLMHEHLNEEEVSVAAEAILDVQSKISNLRALVPPQTAIQEIHRSVDLMVQDGRQKDSHAAEIQCRAGCAHCCRQAVAITPAEADLLIQSAQHRRIAIDENRLARQAGHTEETWAQQPPDDRACVFLGADQRCMIYDARPASCRKYFVLTPPEECDLVQFPKGEAAVWFTFDAEAITSAMFTLDGCDFMPTMLLQALERRRTCDKTGA